MKKRLNFLAIVVFAASCAWAQTAANPSAAKAAWVTSWSASQQTPEPQNALQDGDLHDVTIRQIFHLSAGGTVLRVHLSNAFGTAALHFTSVHIAQPLPSSSSAIDVKSDRTLSFSGYTDVVVPPGAEFVSDPIEYLVAPLSDLAVSFHCDAPPARETGHPGSHATSYYVHGDATAEAELIKAKHVDHWYQISEIDVLASANAKSTNVGAATVVALGDSITDGHGSTLNGNDRWTDVLAQRLQSNPETRNIGVSNQGIGGNHLLTDGLGPNALARFDRDVLAPAGVRWVIVFEGVNDLGGLARDHEVSADEHSLRVIQMIAAYQQIVARAHAHGLRVYGATITPFVGSDYYHPGPLSEANRQTVNQWIRAAGHFDAVIDFDSVVRDPQHTERLLPAFDCGDHLHPSPAGYKEMGNAISLALFAR